MKYKVFSLLFFGLLISCMHREARRPVSVKSSSFMEESVSFNKSLIEKEEAVFKAIIEKDSYRNTFRLQAVFGILIIIRVQKWIALNLVTNYCTLLMC